MKIKEGFMLKEIAGDIVVVPTGNNVVDFSAIIMLNETGSFLWKALEGGADKPQMLKLMLAEYSVDAQTAEADIDSFIQKMLDNNLLDG